MRRKEHSLLYMAKAAVLTEVMNSHRPELLEDRALRGSQPGRQANCQRAEAKLQPHLESSIVTGIRFFLALVWNLLLLDF